MTLSPSEKRFITQSEVRLGLSADVLGDYYGLQAHLVFTSPPYWNQREEYATYASLEDYFAQMKAIFEQCYRLLVEGGICAVNIGQDRQLDLPSMFSMLLRKVGFSYVDTICWNKVGEIGTRGMHLNNNLYYPNFSWEPTFIYRRPTKEYKLNGSLTDPHFPRFEDRHKDLIMTNLRTNVWNVIPERNSEHPAAFPVQLARNAVICYSPAGGIVIDPFGGSGTTAVACNEVGNRKYLLIERMPEYYQMIQKRLATDQGSLF